MALTTPFAQNGDKLAIPQTASDSSVSYNLGFTYAYALPPEEGGKFIDRAQFNQLMYDTTSQVLANKTAIATKANANDTVNLTGNQTINGTKTFNNNIVSPNITQMQNNLNTIFSSTLAPVKTQTTTKTITVGTSGDFTNLLSAINEAKKYTSPVTINLVSDLQLTQSTYINAVNGDHIIINFGNYKITNSASEAIALYLTACSIGQIRNLNLVNINFVVGLCSKTSLTGTGNIQISVQSEAAALFVLQGSSLNIADNTEYTINGSNGSNLISSGTGATLSLSSSSIITTTTQTGNLLTVYNGGIISIHNTATINKPTGLNLYNVTVNTPSGNGLILDKTNRS